MNFIIIIIIIYYKSTAIVRRKQAIGMNIYVSFHKLAASFIYVGLITGLWYLGLVIV